MSFLSILGALFVWSDVAVQRVGERDSTPPENSVGMLVSVDQTPSDRYKVKIVGFDGLDPEFFDYLLHRGSLPNFQRLVDEGASSACSTFKPTKSVVVWTSVATGKTMEKHGIVDWMLLSEDGKERVMATGNARRTEALWNIASRAGRTTRTLNWWATWPVEPVEGTMVSNHFPRSLETPMEEVTHPPSLTEELKALELPRRADAEREMTRAGLPVYSRELSESSFLPSNNFRVRFQTSAGVFNDDMVTEMTSHHLNRTRGPADLEMSLYRTTDVFAHFMWRFIERRTAEPVYKRLREHEEPVTREISRTMDEAYARVLEPVYVHADRRLGRILAETDDNTVVIVLSDHGFQFRNYGFNHYDHGEGGVKAPDGMIFLWGGPVRRRGSVERPSVFDVAPTALYLMGLPVGEDMDGRVLVEALDPALTASRPVRVVASHDLSDRGGAARRSPVDCEVLRELTTLGYVTGSGDDSCVDPPETNP